MRLFILATIIAVGTSCVSTAKTLSINPKKSVIVLEKTDPIKSFAAKELAKHLKLITGVNIPIVKINPGGKYIFHIGIYPPINSRRLKLEESCYKITPKATWFYGDDEGQPINSRSRTGTLFAVYNFLDRELGVKWIAPGNDGIVFKKTKELKLSSGSYDWIPKLPMRGIRQGYSRHMKNTNIPKDFHLSVKQNKQRQMESMLWLKRMRMGKGRVFGYGHAFTKWWEKYGKEHPEYFALNKYGKRAPWRASKPDRIKMCVSNPALQKKIVENYLKRRKANNVINVCENDSAGYCRCPKCCALDAPKKGEEFGKVMTDRYIWFANQVQRQARKKAPDTQAVMYAYSVYRFPPRKVKVDKGVILGFVPKLLVPDSELDAYYKSWNKAGASDLFLRPNDMHVDIGLPMGFEKKMFDNFKICMKYGAFGTDYDSLHNYWPSSGIANYILARGITDPDKSFEYWEDEYCKTFGPASDDVKKYFAYWRKEIWDKRLMPDRETILKKGRYGNFRRGLMWNFQNYYNKTDFDKTDKILQAASKKKLTPAERRRLKTLVLANQHARLMYRAMKEKNARPADADKLRKTAGNLLDFRVKNKKRLNYDWRYLFNNEHVLGDVCGMKMAKDFHGFTPVKSFKERWYFQIDPKNIGLKEKWQDSSYSKINATWDLISTSTCWERGKTHPELMKELKKYDGIGWYAQNIRIPKNYEGKKLYLMFGGVDESCWVYIDGKEVGKHLFKKPDDWKTPFKICIDQAIDWKAKSTTVIVKVEDKSGAGGIWQPVWIVTSK
jgi:Domain of unknown function (DUF4838)/Glycosyl hydrolases family 2, sugar binding domain